MATSTAAAGRDAEGPVSHRARKITLLLLTATYFFSYMDRQILSILLEAIKADLQLDDAQLGYLSGIAFALFYATLGIPIASLADRKSRKNIISIALALWSGMTALCGLAQNFTQLLLARIGVGIGEAGSSPPSHSMIADLYPANERAGALAIYSLGITLGAFAGTFFGGSITHYFDWRTAFLVVGLPGIVLAILVRLFAVEPPRGMSDAVMAASDDTPSILDGARALMKNRAAVHLVAGVTITSLIGYGLTLWSPAYLIRNFGLNELDVAISYAPVVAVAGVVGTVGGGKLADYLATRFGLYAQSNMIAILKLGAFPFLLLFYYLTDVYLAVAAYFVALLLQTCYLGPTFALIQSLAPLRMRSVWAAISLFIINLIGLGIGPTLVGVISVEYQAAFAMNDAESLRWSLFTLALATPWACFHYWRAAIWLKKDGAAGED
ncbi:MFS transporter [Pacificimonas flava]|uniref:MFS transporter n=2 Tax=Pacificimonas TaxID=1960290 RepID=A0A219B490_9SPHN|nr:MULTISPECIES: MFS transporter [Pacificimonas]MBZ6377050.1 MFS transporter [Pacificimonas aurantium]OWV33210.1 MFS transporter [Pacificimonas flava]